MILESLTITKNQSYEANPDGYRGYLRFRNTYGAIELTLNEETSAKILTVVGASAVESAKLIAGQLSSSVFAQTALPKKI